MTVWYSVHDFYLEGGSRLLIELTGKFFFIIWKTVHFLCPVRYFLIKVCLVVIVGFSPRCEVVFTKLANRGICRHSNGPIISHKKRTVQLALSAGKVVVGLFLPVIGWNKNCASIFKPVVKLAQ